LTVTKDDISTEGMDTAEDFGDYLLRTGQVTPREYEVGQAEAKKLLEQVLNGKN